MIRSLLSIVGATVIVAVVGINLQAISKDVRNAESRQSNAAQKKPPSFRSVPPPPPATTVAAAPSDLSKKPQPVAAEDTKQSAEKLGEVSADASVAAGLGTTRLVVIDESCIAKWANNGACTASWQRPNGDGGLTISIDAASPLGRAILSTLQPAGAPANEVFLRFTDLPRGVNSNDTPQVTCDDSGRAKIIADAADSGR